MKSLKNTDFYIYIIAVGKCYSIGGAHISNRSFTKLTFDAYEVLKARKDFDTLVQMKRIITYNTKGNPASEEVIYNEYLDHMDDINIKYGSGSIYNKNTKSGMEEREKAMNRFLRLSRTVNSVNKLGSNSQYRISNSSGKSSAALNHKLDEKKLDEKLAILHKHFAEEKEHLKDEFRSENNALKQNLAQLTESYNTLMQERNSTEDRKRSENKKGNQ